MSSSEIFAALFELGAERESEAVAGEEFCEKLLAVSSQLSVFSKTGGACMQSFRNLRVWEKVTPSDSGCLRNQ